jgi:hypothetical protein
VSREDSNRGTPNYPNHTPIVAFKQPLLIIVVYKTPHFWKYKSLIPLIDIVCLKGTTDYQGFPVQREWANDYITSWDKNTATLTHTHNTHDISWVKLMQMGQDQQVSI